LAVFDRFQRTEQFDTWAGVKAGLSADTTLTVRGHFGLFRDQFMVDQRGNGGPNSLDDYTVSRTLLGEGLLQVDHRVGRHLLTAGVEGYGEFLSGERIDPPSVGRARVGVFVQDEWVLTGDSGGPRLALEPGLRVDADTMFGAEPSPRLAVKIDPIPPLTFRASWGLGFRPATFQELFLNFANTAVGYFVKGNPNLLAEHSGSVNVGVDWRLPWESSTLSLSLWHTSFRDQITVTAAGTPDPNNPVTFRYVNIANSYIQGLELAGRFKISKGTYLDVGYTGTDAWEITNNRPMDRSPHRVNAQLRSKYTPFGLEGVVRATWNSERPFYLGSGNANSIELGTKQIAPAYVDLEVQLTYSRYFFKIFINGYNLLNAGDAVFNPRPPRGVIGGVMLEL
jgi:outer membrane receptor for ferrienterochelin and colicins